MCFIFPEILTKKNCNKLKAVRLMFYTFCYTDLSLFDEFDSLGDADELLVALENAGYVSDSSLQIEIKE